MKKDLAIIGYSFGANYESYIPIYIYSILINYPEYEVLIYTDRKLSDNTKESLELISNMGKFEIIENFNFGMNNDEILNNKNIKTSFRWLFFDERFINYEYLYIGDIDILICKEEKGILKQHIKHMETLGLNYSNYRRRVIRKNKFSIRDLLISLKTNDLYSFVNILKGKETIENRLTGLHFVKTDEYFSKVKQNFQLNVDKLNKTKFYSKIYNDEEVLYNLVEESNLGLPPLTPNSPGFDNNHPETIEFRPHHGIHLGIFRSIKGINNQINTVESYIYDAYFKQYVSQYLEDEIFKSLIKNSNKYVRDVFNNLHEFLEIKIDG